MQWLAHTHSNKGVLDKITEQDYADFKGAVNKAHVHANKDTLDKIDDVAWSTVYGQSHEHSNKEVLDRITAQDYADFKASANKAHVHDNKSTLDKIDETSWLLVYGQTHEHENQSVLDKTTASYTTAEKTKLAGIAAGAEVNQNAFSTIATGSARYAATAKQSAFLIDGDGGTSVSLDTKTGRLTVSSHTHDNKAVLDQLNEEQWKFINSAANKAHAHENQETLDKITDAGWNTVYGNTHSHENQAVLNAVTAAFTTALKEKLESMDLSKYLPKSGGKMTGDIDMYANKKELLIGSSSATSTRSTPVAGGYLELANTMANSFPSLRTFAGIYRNTSNSKQYNVLSIRHRNGYTDSSANGNAYGLLVYSDLTSASNLSWNQQLGVGNWAGAKVLLDSANFKSYALAKGGTAVKADTLTDSGWQIPTFPSGVKSSSIRYRKQGKIVSVTGYVQFSAAQTTITVLTLPTGYRPPAKIQQFNAVDSSAQASFLTKIDTDGKVGFFGKTQGFFDTSSSYYIHCTFFVD